ncbi:MAG: hypothetical protein U9M97_03815 [Candidatus Hadarchaeota archaeon]|nr:hypothetical protein [Candidatus Hadarchaeota archaeon]
MDTSKRNKTAMIIAIVAGILLLVAGMNGVAAWEAIKTFVTTHIIDNIAVQIVFAILIFIASLGGISVIIGGLLIGKNRVMTGKFIIFLGAGMGLIGLIVSTIVAVMGNPLAIGEFMSVGGIGLILSIVARVVAK